VNTTLLGYLASGGFVAVPLVAIGLLLWYLVGLRLLVLRRGIERESLELRLDALARGEPAPEGQGVLWLGLQIAASGQGGDVLAKATSQAITELAGRLEHGRRGIRVLVAVAPLLGLLGTVSGMIETFASLGDMALFSRTGGIAGGISEALVSTQLGLVVAIPGLLVGRVLDQREEELRNCLIRIADFVRAHAREEVA
jgi:biopolymer transport protein ExbB